MEEERFKGFLGEPIQEQVIAVSVVESETFVNEEASTDTSPPFTPPAASLFSKPGNFKKLTTLFGTKFEEDMKVSQQQGLVGVQE